MGTKKRGCKNFGDGPHGNRRRLLNSDCFRRLLSNRAHLYRVIACFRKPPGASCVLRSSPINSFPDSEEDDSSRSRSNVNVESHDMHRLNVNQTLPDRRSSQIEEIVGVNLHSLLVYPSFSEVTS